MLQADPARTMTRDAGTASLFASLEAAEATAFEPVPANSDLPAASPVGVQAHFSPVVDDRLLAVYERARDPSDPLELRDLYLGRVEHEFGGRRHELAQRWTSARVRRSVSEEDVLCSRATIRFVKELFNWFFRDDLYGELRSDSHLILSSGSVDEQEFGLPNVLKECVRYALARDWYGYSDSRGRLPAREALAAYESERSGIAYDERNVALTLGGTFAISALADFLALECGVTGHALCAIPNYPPLAESLARRMDVRLVPLTFEDGRTSLGPLIDACGPDTSVILLQTVTNPTGTAVDEAELERLVHVASPSTFILLDECHECLGPLPAVTTARAAPNVVRVSSISKTWSAPGLKIGWIVADGDFVSRYYEYASTTFGGPPSFFYTFVEVMARMERWILEGIESPSAAELAEFEPSYGLTLDAAGRAYASYRHERLARGAALIALRETAVRGLAAEVGTVMRPSYSINLAVELEGEQDSYLCFRRLLHDTGVAVFPAILTFCLGGAAVRVTTARAREDIDRAIGLLAGNRRLRSLAENGP